MKKKIVSLLLTAAMTITLLAGCGNSDNSTSTSGSANNTQADAAQDAGSSSAADSGEAVTIKLFSNLPARSYGQEG